VHQAGGLKHDLHGHRVPTEQVRAWAALVLLGLSVCLSLPPLWLGGRSVLSCLWVAVDGSIDPSCDIRIIYLLPLCLSFCLRAHPHLSKAANKTNQLTRPHHLTQVQEYGGGLRCLPLQHHHRGVSGAGGVRPPCLPACLPACLSILMPAVVGPVLPPCLSTLTPLRPFCRFPASVSLSLSLCGNVCVCLCVHTHADPDAFARTTQHMHARIHPSPPKTKVTHTLTS